jgi:hypothetical protein
MSSIPAAYDAALAGATINPSTLRWVNPCTIAVDISGETWTARVHVFTTDGLRDALRRALAEYCATHAVAAAASR